MRSEGERVPNVNVVLEDRKAVQLWNLLSEGPS